MKTKIVIKVYDINWDLECLEGRKPPRQFKFEVDNCTIEDGIRNGELDMDELINDECNDRYDTYPDAFEWCFV